MSTQRPRKWNNLKDVPGQPARGHYRTIYDSAVHVHRSQVAAPTSQHTQVPSPRPPVLPVRAGRRRDHTNRRSTTGGGRDPDLPCNAPQGSTMRERVGQDRERVA
jgi:hypothetical protein